MEEPPRDDSEMVPVERSSVEGEGRQPVTRNEEELITAKRPEAIVEEGRDPNAERGQEAVSEIGQEPVGEGLEPFIENGEEPICGEGLEATVGKGQAPIAERGKETVAGEGQEHALEIGGRTVDEVLGKGKDCISGEGHESIAKKVQESVGGKEQDTAEDTIGVDDGTPRLGMKFKTPQEVFRFYGEYARRTGFAIKVMSSGYFEDRRCKYIQLACNRHGKVEYKMDRTMPKTDCKARIALRWRQQDESLHILEVNNEHNHPLIPGRSRSYSKWKQFLGGTVGAGMPSYKSGMQGLGENKHELRLGKGDVEALHRFFVGMQTKNSYFFHSMDLNEEGRLKTVFWADGRSRTAYRYFGDVILFDATYLIDKFDLPLVSIVGVNHHGQMVLLGCCLLSDESSETYSWLFKAFLSCMLEKAPSAVITDRGKAMQEAVAEVFPRARHRQCMWHIMKRISENLQGLAEYDETKETLESIVYDSLRANEFEEDWKKMIEKYGLEENELLKSLYEDRHFWAPVFVKDTFWAGMSITLRGESVKSFFDESVDCNTTLQQFLNKYEFIVQSKYEKELHADSQSLHKRPALMTQLFMEEQFCKVYTIGMFKKFQDEVNALIYCVSSLVNVEGQLSTFEVKEHVTAKDGRTIEQRSYEVLYNESQLDVQCICCSFYFRGILCRHALSVLNFQDMVEIPSRYIVERWRKDYKRIHSLHCISNEDMADNPLERHENFRKNCLKLAEIGLISDQKYKVAVKVVDETIQKLLADDSTCEETRPQTLPCEAELNGHMVSFAMNNSSNLGNENRGAHNPLLVGRQVAKHPHFQFFQDRVQPDQQSASYRSGAEWNFQQYFHEA